MKTKKALVVITWRKEATSSKKVLLFKLIPARGGFWQPITGGVDEGETYAEGAKREAEEESGLNFERQPQNLGLDFEYESRHGGQVLEKCFHLPVVGGNSPPTPKLDPKEHDDFLWLDPAPAAAKVKFPGNKQAIERASQNLPPLLLTKAGIFMQEGEEITHERTALLLHRSLVRNGENYLVRMGEEELEVVVEESPRFVTSYRHETGEISLRQGEVEKLDPATLKIKEGNRLVCQTAEGLEALFLSPAYYEITKHVSEGLSGKEFLLHFLGRDYRFPISS